MGPQAETERLQKRFETLRFGRDEYEKDEFLERWNETIQIGEHLLTIYEAEDDCSSWVLDIAYHLIRPCSDRDDYYGISTCNALMEGLCRQSSISNAKSRD